jgi:hypothetical protein
MDDGDASWIVVLEVPTDLPGWALERVVQLLADVHALALHGPDRYAVQMSISAGGQPEALFVALARLQGAVAAVSEPRPRVVRAEVMSREEFERDCRVAYGHSAPSLDGPTPW